MNLPKILLTIGGIITAGIIAKNYAENEIDKRTNPEKDYILKQKIEADGPPEHNTEKIE